MRGVNVVGFLTLTAALVVACMPGFEGDEVATNSKAGSKTNSDAVKCGEAGAAVTLTPQDPEKFPKCACEKGGKARCIPKDKVPSNVSSKLDTCEDGGPGVCVP